MKLLDMDELNENFRKIKARTVVIELNLIFDIIYEIKIYVFYLYILLKVK